MPYYHIRIKRVRGRPSYVYEFDLSRKKLEALLNQAKKGIILDLSSYEWIEERDIEDIDIAQTSKKSSHYGIGRLKGVSIFEEGRIVTSQFIKKPVSRKASKKIVFPNTKLKQEVLSKNVFIVHGRDHKPMKELKTMLKEFGLDPTVLHEKASGSLTLPEKLEKYSRDIGFAFVLLTPDDIGCHKTEVDGVRSELNAPFMRRTVAVSGGYVKSLLNKLKPRARQNVIFEMGFFWGLLERKKVCCLLKGDVEKPSDMEGIVYIHFRESVNEVRNKIAKELKAVGYKIKR